MHGEYKEGRKGRSISNIMPEVEYTSIRVMYIERERERESKREKEKERETKGVMSLFNYQNFKCF